MSVEAKIMLKQAEWLERSAFGLQNPASPYRLEGLKEAVDILAAGFRKRAQGLRNLVAQLAPTVAAEEEEYWVAYCEALVGFCPGWSPKEREEFEIAEALET